MDKHLQPSHLNSTFHSSGVSFEEYILHMSQTVTNARLDLTSENKAQIIAANIPAAFVPDNNSAPYGVVLLHGLLDSPYVMQDCFEVFKTENVPIFSLLLPGHGTVPGDLLEVQLESWTEATVFAIRALRKLTPRILVVGFSTGAGLALQQALQNETIDALILFAPTLLLKSRCASLTRFMPYLQHFFKKAEWLEIKPENDYAKYRSIAMNAVHQVYRLTEQLQSLRQQKSLTTPTFMIVTDDDESISTPAVIQYFTTLSNPCNQLWLYSTRPLQYSDSRITVRNSAYPQEKILNFSHVSLLHHPNNPHYGRHSDLQDFAHYSTWWGSALSTFADKNEWYQGALTANNLHQAKIQRLTYNPDFDALQEALLEFARTTFSKS